METLRSLGKVATCNPAGAGKWDSGYAGKLDGAKVIIVPDKDNTGRKHAREVYDSLLGFAQSVQVLEPKTGKDVTDHVKAGHSTLRAGAGRPRSALLFSSPCEDQRSARRRRRLRHVPGASGCLGRSGTEGWTAPLTEPGGDYQVCCPVHEDTHPSATVGTGATAPVVFRCHRGCTQEEFVDALVELGVPKTLLMENRKGPTRADVVRPLSA